MEKKRELEVQEYWRSKEQELGEPILLKSISHTYQSGGLEAFGVLFASQNYLVFEYAKSSRRSILEILFSRREEKLSEQVKLARGDIRRVGIIPTPWARRWIARSLGPAEVENRLRSGKSSPLASLLGGSSLCLCTSDTCLVLDTPSNRQWLALLGR
jgi:hypothetical protein